MRCDGTCLVATFLLSFIIQCQCDAVGLGSDNIDENFQKSAAPWLVLFHAPWCGHCKRLVPVWDEVAATAREEGLNVSLAKVDCSSHQALCEKWGATSSYPALKVFKDRGERVVEYRGGRRKETILPYVRRVGSPAVTVVNTQREAKEFIAREPVSFVYFAQTEPGPEAEKLRLAFEEAAEGVHDVASLAVASEDAADDLGLRVFHALKPLKEDESLGGRLIAFREGEGKCFPEDGEASAEAVGRWIQGHRVVLLPRLDSANYNDVARRGKPLVISVLRGRKDPPPAPGAPPAPPPAPRAGAEVGPGGGGEDGAEDEGDDVADIPINAEFLVTMRSVARELDDSFAFGYLDGKVWQQFVVRYGISTRVLPRLLIIDAATDDYLPVPVDVKGHRATADYLAKVAAKEVRMSRQWSSLAREAVTDYPHYIAAGALAVAVAVGLWLYLSAAPSPAAGKDDGEEDGEGDDAAAAAADKKKQR